MKFVILVIMGVCGITANAKKIEVRKTQEVDFDELSLKGTVRNPDGAYLVQKEGIQFMPLYEVKKDLDQKIRLSADK